MLFLRHSVHSFKLLAHKHDLYNTDTSTLSCPILGFRNTLSCRKNFSAYASFPHTHIHTHKNITQSIKVKYCATNAAKIQLPFKNSYRNWNTKWRV